MAIYWITGFSGAGKSSIGREFYNRLKFQGKNVVFLDGDDLRVVLGSNNDFSKKARKKNALIYSRLCKLLADQGVSVVIATISMFDDVRNWNRANIVQYVEIYIKVPLNILEQRDQKNLYSTNQKNVVGFNIQYEEPKLPDIVLINDNSLNISDITSKLEVLIDEKKIY